jgi:predicted GTPase
MICIDITSRGRLVGKTYVTNLIKEKLEAEGYEVIIANSQLPISELRHRIISAKPMSVVIVDDVEVPGKLRCHTPTQRSNDLDS